MKRILKQNKDVNISAWLCHSVFLFSRESDSRIANVRQSVRQSQKPIWPQIYGISDLLDISNLSDLWSLRSLRAMIYKISNHYDLWISDALELQMSICL